MPNPNQASQFHEPTEDQTPPLYTEHEIIQAADSVGRLWRLRSILEKPVRATLVFDGPPSTDIKHRMSKYDTVAVLQLLIEREEAYLIAMGVELQHETTGEQDR